MSDFLTVIHECKDYAIWRKAYDADLPRRKEAGLTELHVLRDNDTPNLVGLMYEVSDLAKARGFITSPGLAEVMTAAGIVAAPRIRFRTGTYSRSTAGTLATLSLTVKDYDTAMKAYAMDAADRKAATITDHAVLQEIGKPGDILLLWSVEDIARVNAFLDSPKLAEHMAKVAGVITPPERHFWKP